MLQSMSAAIIEDYSYYLMMKFDYKFRTMLMIVPNLLSVVLSILAMSYVFNTNRYLGRVIPTAILKIIDYDKKYVVIGKPCDIEALINYTNLDEKMKKCIKYTMTFFCAGAPSKNATLKLAENLGVQADQIESVRYRGNGWPGKATVTLKDKSERHMDYIDSWNQILGRNIMFLK